MLLVHAKIIGRSRGWRRVRIVVLSSLVPIIHIADGLSVYDARTHLDRELNHESLGNSEHGTHISSDPITHLNMFVRREIIHN